METRTEKYIIKEYEIQVAPISHLPLALEVK